MPVLWYRDPADQVMKPYPAGGPSVAGRNGYAGSTMNTDLVLTAANTRYGVIFDTTYGTPSGMTTIPKTTGASAGASITGNCSLFTIQKTGWYDVRVIADLYHATASTEANVELCVYVNASEKSGWQYVKKLAGANPRIGPNNIAQGSFNAGDVVSVSVKCYTSTGWSVTWSQIIILSL